MHTLTYNNYYLSRFVRYNKIHTRLLYKYGTFENSFTDLEFLIDDEIKDISGKAHTITQFPTTIPILTDFSKSGNASFDFSTAERYIEINEPIIFGTNDFTIDFWVFQTLVTNFGTLFEYGNYYNGILLRQRSSNSFEFIINNIIYIFSSNLLNINQWTHIAFQRRNNIYEFIVNGVLVYQVSGLSNNFTGTDKLIRLGSSRHTVGQFFRGAFDLVRISNGRAIYSNTSFTPKFFDFSLNELLSGFTTLPLNRKYGLQKNTSQALIKKTLERALDLVYCSQDLSVLFRDTVGVAPYNLASELIYCSQDLSVLFRDAVGVAPYNLASELIYCSQDLSGLNRELPTLPQNPLKYIKIEMDGILGEFQVNWGAGMQAISNLTLYKLTGTNLQYQTPSIEAISDGSIPTSNIEYVGTTSAVPCTITIGLPSSNPIIAVGLAPQTNSSTQIYNVPGFINIYESADNINYTLLKAIAVGTRNSSVVSPFTSTILRPSTLTIVNI